MGYEKVCGACGRPFLASDVRRVYCDACRFLGAGKNRSRRESRAAHDLSFVGVDGEGVDRPDGSHDYVMLSVGNRTLHRDGARLDLREILSFLWECHQETPDACFVGFFLGYDFAQWFRQLPEREARLLFTDAGMASRKSERKTRSNPLPDPVVWQGWELDIMAGRRFRLRPHRHQKSLFSDECRNRTCRVRVEHPPRKDSTTGKGWFYLCDTGSFWQTSFVNVIKPENWHGEPPCTAEEFAAITDGKAGRSRVVDYGATSYLQSMQHYNTLENIILGRVTARLNQGFSNEQIPIHLKKHEWFGPGRAAQTWMDLLHKKIADPSAIVYNRKRSFTDARRNEKGILSADINLSVPAWFNEAAQASYYGGWFEIPMHGHIGHVWEYDINSAYPHIIASLPCLHTDHPHTGKYSRGAGDSYPRGDGSYTLLYGTFRGDDPYIGALPHRTRVGSVLRPHVTKGWYWAHEVESARSAGLVNDISVETWVSYYPCHCSPPFNLPYVGIERMYFLRLAMGKNTPGGKAFKLVYNSAYGKTAQSIGSPKYASAVYASLITAGTRANICDAIASHPERSRGVAMVATDGIYFTSRHSQLELSPTVLGAWDETYREDMTLLMPGVYWDAKTRTDIGAGIAPKMKSRGVAARDLADQIGRLDHEWAVMNDRISRGNFEPHFPKTMPNGEVRMDMWPTITLPIRFAMTSPKLALHRNDWKQAGGVLHNTVRQLSADPISKRANAPYMDDGVIRSGVHAQWRTVETTPYTKRFGWVDEDDELITRDGSMILDDFQQLLQR